MSRLEGYGRDIVPVGMVWYVLRCGWADLNSFELMQVIIVCHYIVAEVIYSFFFFSYVWAIIFINVMLLISSNSGHKWRSMCKYWFWQVTIVWTYQPWQIDLWIMYGINLGDISHISINLDFRFSCKRFAEFWIYGLLAFCSTHFNVKNNGKLRNESITIVTVLYAF